MFFLNYSEIIKNIKYFVERTIYIYIEIYIYLFILQKHYISPLKVKESFLWLCCSFFSLRVWKLPKIQYFSFKNTF